MSSFFRQSYIEQREILILVADPNSLEVCSSSALSMIFPFGCWSVISTMESWLPRDCYKEFVKDHKSLAAKKNHPAAPWLNSLLDTPWHQRKMFEALQTDKGGADSVQIGAGILGRGVAHLVLWHFLGQIKSVPHSNCFGVFCIMSFM